MTQVALAILVPIVAFILQVCGTDALKILVALTMFRLVAMVSSLTKTSKTLCAVNNN